MLQTSGRFIMPVDNVRFPGEKPRDKVPLERARSGVIQSSSGTIPRALTVLLPILVPHIWAQHLALQIVVLPSLKPEQVGSRLLSCPGTCRFYQRKPFHPLVKQFASRITPRPSLNGGLRPAPLGAPAFVYQPGRRSSG